MKSVLSNCKYIGACAWHIVAIDLTNALKNIHDYQACKKFFVDKLVNSKTCQNKWEEHFRVACQTWPAASEYLNELYGVKQRWGSAWRMDHFTQGKQASSAVEGSFHGFKDFIGGEPKIYWISRAVIDKWSNSGNSTTKYVFVQHKGAGY